MLSIIRQFVFLILAYLLDLLLYLLLELFYLGELVLPFLISPFVAFLQLFDVLLQSRDLVLVALHFALGELRVAFICIFTIRLLQL